MEIDEDEPRSIQSLGLDQLLHILQFLPVSAIISFGVTCRRFYEIVQSDVLWARICKREWGEAVVSAWPESRRRKLSWKQLYGEMLFCGTVVWHCLSQWEAGPCRRASHSLNMVGGKLLLFGGGSEGGRDLGDTWIAEVPSNFSEGIRWQRANIGNPSGRFGHSCVVVEDTLVLFGGINESGQRHLDTWVNCVSESLSSWQLLRVGQSPLARGAHASSYAGEKKVVVFGGIRNDGVRLGDTWMLDLSQEEPRWQRLVTEVSPPARSGHTLTWIGGKRMVLFGGRGAHFEVLNDVWLLDLEGNTPTWTELRPSINMENVCTNGVYPPPRAGHSASLIFGRRILIYGGEDSKRVRKGDVWVLDPEMCSSWCTDAPRRYVRKFWKKLKVRGELPRKRSFHGACSIQSGHGVFVFGGMVDGYSSGLEFNSEMLLLQLVP